MTDPFARAKAAASANGARVQLNKALNLSGGMLKEGMSPPSVFARFPSARTMLEQGTLASTLGFMVDLTPFSSFVAGAKAEEVRDVLNFYYEETVPIIEANNGVIEKYIGDAVIALFGAPFGAMETTVDNVYDAFTAARQVTSKVNSMFRGEILAKCSIAFGEMFLGLVGPQSHAELTAVGNPLTVLFRLEEIAEENMLVLRSDLYKLLEKEKGFGPVTGPGKPGETWTDTEATVPLRGVGSVRVTKVTFKV